VIIYDLRCEKEHTFEGWFRDNAAFEEQKKGSLIVCPVCGSTHIQMVPSSITFMGKDARESQSVGGELSPMKTVRMFQEYINKTFEDVGSRFAEVALKIHRGEDDPKNIRGVTTHDEEKMLREEGVEFIKIPVPKYDS
jgi:hypothetical protein